MQRKMVEMRAMARNAPTAADWGVVSIEDSERSTSSSSASTFHPRILLIVCSS